MIGKVRLLILCKFMYNKLCTNYVSCSPKEKHLDLEEMLEESIEENTFAMHQEPRQTLFAKLIRPHPPTHRTLSISDHRRQHARCHLSRTIV